MALMISGVVLWATTAPARTTSGPLVDTGSASWADLLTVALVLFVMLRVVSWAFTTAADALWVRSHPVELDPADPVENRCGCPVCTAPDGAL